jgi:uncharacterized protein YybS (DUF2232 family)
MQKAGSAAIGIVLSSLLFATLVGVAATSFQGSATHATAQAASEGMATGDPTEFLKASMEADTQLRVELMILGALSCALSGAISSLLFRQTHWVVAVLDAVPLLALVPLGGLPLRLAAGVVWAASASAASWLVLRRTQPDGTN